MKQTAVDFLIEKLDNNLDIKHSWRTKQYIEQAKEMEKEQIINAYWDGNQDVGYKLLAEQYYNETFKSE
jgi:ABC-type enterochelin transport system ATPase subunit